MTENIFTLIPKIREEVGAVRKDQTAQAGARYSYRSADQVINALVPILNKYGVFTTVTDLEHTIHEREVGSKVVTVAKLLKKVTFYAGDGSNVSSTVASESSDYSDKATGAAQTYAYRYALLQTFTLPTDEDDPDSKYVEKEASSAAQTAPATPKEPTVIALQTQIKALIQDKQNPYTSDSVNALGDKVTGKPRTEWIKSKDDLTKILTAIKAGEVA